MLNLLPHQTTGINFLVNKLNNGINPVLFDSAGTGKTLQGLNVAREFTPIGKICLWVTLASLKNQLENEVIKFGIDFTPIVLNGTKVKRNLTLQAAQNALNGSKPVLLIINYEELLCLPDLSFMATLPITIIIADECTKLCNQKNRTYKNLKKLADYVKAKKVAMSGTVISNNPMEAYSLFEFLNSGTMGNWFTFVSRYFVPNMFSRVGYVRTSRLPELAARLEPYYLRREREVLLPDLPDLMEEVLPVTMTAKENKLYSQIRSSLLLEIAKEEINKIETPHTMDSGIVKFLRLRQLCVSPELLGENHESSKLTALKEFLSTINGSKALIFTEFATAIPHIQANLPIGSSLVIQGSTSQELRQGIVDQFMTDPSIKYLIGTKALEMGLNLTKADYVIHLDPPLTYSSYDQRCSRARRQGRNDKVISVRMVTAGSLEQRIYKLIESKKLISLSAMPYSLMKEIIE